MEQFIKKLFLNYIQMPVDKQVNIIKSDILSSIGHEAVELRIKSNAYIFGHFYRGLEEIHSAGYYSILYSFSMCLLRASDVPGPLSSSEKTI